MRFIYYAITSPKILKEVIFLAVPAAFIDRTIISVNVKGNVILPCQAQSALNVSWYKNGDTVNKGYLTERKNNFILHFNGDLEIVNVADNDYGNYTCFENGNKPLSFVELNRDKGKYLTKSV